MFKDLFSQLLAHTHKFLVSARSNARQWWQPSFLVFFIINTLVRFYNYRHSLYFIWDQGRDAWAIHHLAQGDFTLIGPTSGLHGFFLGPLWFYLGLPGYLVGNQSPYGIALGYMLISLLGLPIIWLITKKLWGNNWWAQLAAWFVAFHPGSIMATLYIWNPLIAVPLMGAAYLAFLKARQSRTWLAGAFFMLALTLQSEFAYAIFFVITLWLLIPWIRQRFSWKDYAVATMAIAVTGLPQVLFELRNRFIMTRSLWKALLDKERLVSWSHLWSTRPQQLWFSTQERLFGGHIWADYLMWVILILILVGVASWLLNLLSSQAVASSKESLNKKYAWTLLGIFALVPYGWYLFWRGNYGYFFDYYLTAHFLFLVPWLIKGVQFVWSSLVNNRKAWFLPALVVWSFLALWLGVTLNMVWNVIVFPENEAGIASMESSVEQLYWWSEQDKVQQPVFRIFTPNLQTENYDYLVHWYANRHQQPVPLTTKQTTDEIWYVLIEPDRQAAEMRFKPWYEEVTEGGVLVRQQKDGIHILETWMKPEVAEKRGLEPITTSLLSF